MTSRVRDSICLVVEMKRSKRD